MKVRAIIISDTGRLLLGRNQNNCYSLIGGDIEEGEHPVDALLREVKEETGIVNFVSIEYLWEYLDNYVFIFVPEGNLFQVNCANDPSQEFQVLEWINMEALPSNLDSYSEDIIYRFLRLEVVHNSDEGQQEESMKKSEAITAGHIDVIVDGKKAFQLDDDTIWQTLPRLAQERSKGKKIEFKQVLDDGTVVDQSAIPMPTKEDVDTKEKAVAWLRQYPTSNLILPLDNDCFCNSILLDVSSELLNPSVQILKMADTFDNTLLFDGKDEFWITNMGMPVWRSSYADRYASYEEITQVWNIKYPDHNITIDWFKSLLKKMFERKSSCPSCCSPVCECKDKKENKKEDKKENKKEDKKNEKKDNKKKAKKK